MIPMDQLNNARAAVARGMPKTALTGDIMTDADLATCRAWCAANEVEIVECQPRHNGDRWQANKMPKCYGMEITYTGSTEQKCYERIWKGIAPIIQSVRNLDAMETEGPYKVQHHLVREGKQYWCVTSSMTFDYFGEMSEQSARVIANILNREARGE